jgi:hypothetical protein
MERLVAELREAGMSGKFGKSNSGKAEDIGIWVRDKYSCVYCGMTMMDESNRWNWYTFQIDHVLPKRKYPEFANSSSNKVLSCSLCNSQIKGTYDPGEGYEIKDEQDLAKYRNELIDTCKAFIRRHRDAIAASYDRIIPIIAKYRNDNKCWP